MRIHLSRQFERRARDTPVDRASGKWLGFAEATPPGARSAAGWRRPGSCMSTDQACRTEVSNMAAAGGVRSGSQERFPPPCPRKSLKSAHCELSLRDRALQAGLERGLRGVGRGAIRIIGRQFRRTPLFVTRGPCARRGSPAALDRRGPACAHPDQVNAMRDLRKCGR